MKAFVHCFLFLCIIYTCFPSASSYSFTLEKFNPKIDVIPSKELSQAEFLNLHPYKQWKYWNDFQYGFPDVSIGTIFPTLPLVINECPSTKKELSHRKSRNKNILISCYLNFLALYCARYHYADFPKLKSATLDVLKNESSYKICLKKFQKHFYDEYTILFTRPYLDGSKSNIELELTGFLDKSTLKAIKEKFVQCVLKTKESCDLMKWENCPRPHRFCGFDLFAEMFLRAHITRKRQKNITPMADTTYLSAMFLYFYCQQGWVDGEPLCPNPCDARRNPCVMKKNSYLSRCLTIKNGVHKRDFECLCMKGFKWDPYVSECVVHNLCLESDDKLYPCTRHGTKRCIFSPQHLSNPTYTCVCKLGYMGSKCSDIRDPCIQRQDPRLPSGYNACRSHQGGTCVPRHKTDYYICKCPAGWTNIESVRFLNCFKKLYGCGKILCRNGGKCKESPDGSVVLCVCTSGWEGKTCELYRRREWLNWDPWSRCTVNCGEGWNIRRRICRTGLNADCGGIAQEIRSCVMACQGLEEKYMPIAMMLQYIQITLISIAAINFALSYILRFRIHLIREFVLEKRDTIQREITRELREREEKSIQQRFFNTMNQYKM